VPEPVLLLVELHRERAAGGDRGRAALPQDRDRRDRFTREDPAGELRHHVED
jgi:hypothetical protein